MVPESVGSSHELGVDGMFTNFPDRLMSLRSPH